THHRHGKENTMPVKFRLVLAVGLALTLLDHTASRAAADTIFSLSFENTLAGDQGQIPTQASGVSFVPGVVGSAGFFSNGNVLRYASSGNINSSVGTLDFFLIPNWNGNDGLNHAFLSWGGGGGMIFAKDAANNLRGIFNRFAVGGQPELEALSNVS